jgi:hypothetical protein
MRSLLCVTAIIGLLAARPVEAGPLKSKDVAAGAKWVVHVDFDAMRDSKLGATFREKCLANEDAQHKIKKCQEDTGVDLTKDMHSVTLYDTKFVEHSGVAIFRASHIDGKKLLAKLKEKHPDHKSEKHGDTTIYTWTEAKDKKHEHQVSGAMYGKETILFSRDAEQVGKALDVLAGKADSLAEDSPLAEAPAKGTFMVMRGVGMDKEKTPFHMAVVRSSKQLSIALGQQGSDVFAQGLLVTPNAESAAKVRTVVEGFRALAQLRFGDRDKEMDMLRDLKLVVAGSAVAMEWRANGEDVEKMMAKHHEKMERMRKEWKYKHDRDGKPGAKPDKKEKKSSAEDDKD